VTSPLLRGIHWLGHDGFRIEGAGKVVYLDPYRVAGDPPRADLILVSHDHYDHCSPEDVARLAGPGTVIAAPASCAGKLGGRVTVVRAGETHTLGGVTVETVPAYNLNKRFHPRANGGVGYILTLDGRRIYHAGDTDFIPEMRALAVDVALVPVGGTYTMTAAEAAEAVNAFRPKIAVPMHFGSVVGTEVDAREFKRLAQVPVELPPP
jgi:L-ascorbate metabolism protein UlaG (beta-lactamase superfamily)